VILKLFVIAAIQCPADFQIGTVVVVVVVLGADASS
jgi:hypothetical protein